jgi:hypothetical protein
VFGKQDSDKPEDFEGLFDLDQALRSPFIAGGADAHVGV